MTDSPAFNVPLDPEEQPILDRILTIRDKLSLLKQDRSTYIKSHDVLELYEQVIEQVHLLNIIREEHDKALEQNRGAVAPNRAGDEPWAQLTYYSLGSGQCSG